MLRKYKYLLVGFILGVIVVSTLPISAAIEKYVLTKAPYKIIVNGSEYKDDSQPALNLNGNTYVPLRNLGKLLGQEPKWNAEKKQVELGVAQTGEPDPKVWITTRDLYNKLGSTTTFQPLLDQIVNINKSGGKDGMYDLVYNDKTVKMQLIKSRAYLNIQDLTTTGIYTE